MKTKYVKVPFDVELAKKITNGEVDGRIVTRDGRSARIICWDKKGGIYPVFALIDNGYEEIYKSYTNEGIWNTDETCTLKRYDLMLEIPEYMTFKDGDILISECGTPFIYKDIKGRHGCFSAYCAIDLQDKIFFDIKDWTYEIKCKANESQCKVLIDKLKSSKEPKAKECLKMLGIEVKPECEFKPFDKVLVRNSLEMEWIPRFFERATQCYESIRYITLDNNSWKYCIPYNEKTECFLGTIENFE